MGEMVQGARRNCLAKIRNRANCSPQSISSFGCLDRAFSQAMVARHRPKSLLTVIAQNMFSCP